jgi:hypothetical protein
MSLMICQDPIRVFERILIFEGELETCVLACGLESRWERSVVGLVWSCIRKSPVLRVSSS